MEFLNKTIVVTGAASGIGLALATRFVREGATVIASDRNAEVGGQKATEIGARFVAADIGQEEGVSGLIADVLEREGQIDLFCSNAGIAVGEGPETPDRIWDRIHRINVMSHVWAARHLLPHFLERGAGYFLNTASAAGLLTELHSAPYAVTKHAALAFAEWLAITYADRGIKVSALCPEGVWTPMIQNAPLLQQRAISTEELVEVTLGALREERFLITTHDTTLAGFQLKGQDYGKWLGKMTRLRGKAMALLGEHEAAFSAGEAPRTGGHE
ncbi:SDR family NAD(P)-dependent oxidoreductase [Deinococcus hopiensis]|uniref:Short-chain dehydrogenase n=1 Tax=Deinococcus hopiensis KR-140 TaxID=695939 RepID=A0A1W1UF37_9DEIO|nr:SDR family oxidoreductase [Deinococcus hopiensis]SMB79715.1 Short-chain dehydrogenase [Deinococcus hopiensis KR-140]